MVDSGRIEAAVAELLLAIGDDPTRPGIRDTPRRVADAYAEFFSGMGVDPLEALRDAEPLPKEQLGELVIVRDIAFRSVCEHHLLPFTGVAHLAYAPSDRIVGLGALARVVETLSARPQLQEPLTEQIADALEAGLGARGVVVVLDARHQCVATRGPRQADSTTVTLATRGTLSEPVARAEVMGLIGRAELGDRARPAERLAPQERRREE